MSFYFNVDDVKDFSKSELLETGSYIGVINFVSVKDKNGAHLVTVFFKVIRSENRLNLNKIAPCYFGLGNNYGKSKFKELLLTLNIKQLNDPRTLEGKVVKFDILLKPQKFDATKMENVFTFHKFDTEEQEFANVFEEKELPKFELDSAENIPF